MSLTRVYLLRVEEHSAYGDCRQDSTTAKNLLLFGTCSKVAPPSSCASTTGGGKGGRVRRRQGTGTRTDADVFTFKERDAEVGLARVCVLAKESASEDARAST